MWLAFLTIIDRFDQRENCFVTPDGMISGVHHDDPTMPVGVRFPAGHAPSKFVASMTGNDQHQDILNRLGDRLIVFVGLMASGKTSVGRVVAQRLGIPFVDADHEIEAAARMSVSEIFEKHGEAYFRSGEKRVIERLLKEGPRVLATGGGAFMNAETRDNISHRGVSIWLKSDVETLLKRARRRNNRPLLQNDDPEGTLRRLMDERYPIYAHADITVNSTDGPQDATADDAIAALINRLADKGPHV
jgi:shikimate kinase